MKLTHDTHAPSRYAPATHGFDLRPSLPAATLRLAFAYAVYAALVVAGIAAVTAGLTQAAALLPTGFAAMAVTWVAVVGGVAAVPALAARAARALAFA